MKELAGYETVGAVQRPNGTIYYPRRIGGYEDLALMEAWRDRKQFAFFSGPPGTGKSALVDAVFEGERVDGTPRRQPTGAEYLVCSRNTTEADFLGGWIKEGSQYVWVDGPLIRSLRRDVPFFADEVLLPDSRTFSPLYPLLDGRNEIYVSANPSMGPVKMGPNWYFCGAGNPDVPGAQFSEALRDRFWHYIEISTDWTLCARLGCPQGIITVAQILDHKRVEGSISWSPQMRSLLVFKEMEELYGTDYAASALLSKTPTEDRDVVAQHLHDHGYNSELLQAETLV